MYEKKLNADNLSALSIIFPIFMFFNTYTQKVIHEAIFYANNILNNICNIICLQAYIYMLCEKKRNETNNA